MSESGNVSNETVDVFTSLVSGACAGALAKSVIAPLDRTKIMFQVSKTPFTYAKAVYILSRSYEKHGIRSWWRGNSATVARVAPYAAIQFTAHAQFKKFMGSTHNQALPPMERFLAGSFAGVTSACFTYPLDMVRARMAVSRKNRYNTLGHTFEVIYKEEGARAFYNGFIPTIIGIVPYAGFSFFIYESLKKRYHANHPNEDMKVYYRLMYGAAAGLCGQSFTYPMDIVRRRMQTDGIDGKGYKYQSMTWTLKYVLRTEGVIKGFFKGLSINFIKGPVAVGISFATYDTVKHVLEVFTGTAERIAW